MGTANHRAYSFEMKPTIQQVEKNGKLVWRVEAAGIVRYHEQDWQAQWLYTYLTRLYNCDETNPQQLSHGPSQHELDDTSSRSD